MDAKRVFHVTSFVILVIGFCLGFTGWVSYHFGDPVEVQRGIRNACYVTLFSGLVLWATTRVRVDLSRRDGFGIVTFGWIFAAAFGSLPFLFTGVIPDVTGAFFETMSGFTTTGASVLTDLESLPKGILFWRCLTQWLGGMGVLVLCVAILPFLGVSGMQIYKAEMPGPSKDRLTPRIARTAELLWGVYLLITLAQTGLLKLAGMSWFDAVCHTFATVSTGGFSTRTGSIGAYNDPMIECIVVVFMVLAGINFAVHYRVLTGKPLTYIKDPECRMFLLIWLACCLIVGVEVWGDQSVSFLGAMRDSFFQVTSLMTTTGFATENYDQWSVYSRLLLLALMFCGACAGSTSGSIKVIRVYILVKRAILDVRAHILPHAVLRLKVNKKPVEQDVVSKIATFFIIFLMVGGIATLIMSFFMPDPFSAGTAVVATLCNIGPGFGAVGPAETYGFVPAPGKWVLSLCMLLGRLELYTVLVLFLPEFWRR